jgi:hypothetical protein
VITVDVIGYGSGSVAEEDDEDEESSDNAPPATP